MIITIDGPAGSGKSTTAKLVASALGYLYLDTGAMYRTIALAFHQQNQPISEESIERFMPQISIGVDFVEGEIKLLLNEEDVSPLIRSAEISELASKISQFLPVREQMTQLQRNIASACIEKGIGVVCEGRDMGTVVFPEAAIKIFMVASLETRALRRWKEQSIKGEEGSLNAVGEALAKRDKQDESREIAPLKPAPDAILLDTSQLSIQEQVDFVTQQVNRFLD